MVAIWKFLFRVIVQYHKIWKTTFPKVFDKFFAHLADYQTNIWNKIVKILLWDYFIGKTDFAVLVS